MPQSGKFCKILSNEGEHEGQFIYGGGTEEQQAQPHGGMGECGHLQQFSK